MNIATVLVAYYKRFSKAMYQAGGTSLPKMLVKRRVKIRNPKVKPDSPVKKRKSNNPRLITPIGKFLENLTYWQIATSIVLSIGASAWYFHSTPASSTSIHAQALDWVDAIYFSVITFTSLGYGDIHPIDNGKIVAASEVLFGLISIALLVGKLASEQQYALLLLTYTSAQQKRLVRFRKAMKRLRNKIRYHFADYNHGELYKVIDKNFGFVFSISNYLTTHSNEGRLAYSGNAPALRKLYKSFIKTQLLLYKILRTAHIEERTIVKIDYTLEKINSISAKMRKFHRKDDTIIDRFKEIQKTQGDIQKWRKLKLEGKAKILNRGTPTEFIIAKVNGELSAALKSDDIARIIAKKLNIEYGMAKQCIAILRQREREKQSSY